jgi:LPXTG-site transpeptidase (sortase) family protein
MKSRLSSKSSLIAIGIIGMTFPVIMFFAPALGLSGQESYAKNIPSADGKLPVSLQSVVLGVRASLELPTRLKIPSINVSAAIKYVGLTSQGAMDVPKGPADVALFSLGPRPGEVGSAVISGHFGPWKNGGGSVFDNLNKLKKGDKLYVVDGKGVTVSFMVRESRSYDPNGDASGVFGSNDGKAHLNLVTCEGTWIKAQKTYTNRLVIFADKVDH